MLLTHVKIDITEAKTEVPNPLTKTLVDGVFNNGGNKTAWVKARYLESAHVSSGKAGEPDIIVLMRANYNRKFSGDLELAGTVVPDEVFDIGSIGMDRRTAWDLVDQKWLHRSVVENAKKIDLRHLEF